MRAEDHLARDYVDLNAETNERITTLALIYDQKIERLHDFYLRRIGFLWVYAVVITAIFFIK